MSVKIEQLSSFVSEGKTYKSVHVKTTSYLIYPEIKQIELGNSVLQSDINDSYLYQEMWTIPIEPENNTFKVVYKHPIFNKEISVTKELK